VAVVAGMMAPVSAWGSSMARLDLGAPACAGFEARVRVEIALEGEEDDVLSIFDLSTTGSDAALSGRIRFEKGPALAGWTVLDPLDDDGAGSYEASLGQAEQLLGPGSHVLGTLVVDLRGLKAGTTHTLLVDGPPWPTRFVGTQGPSGELLLLDAESGGLAFGSPEGVDVSVANLAIPEPISALGVLVATMSAGAYARGRRG
jgi:hypothetical protein